MNYYQVVIILIALTVLLALLYGVMVDLSDQRRDMNVLKERIEYLEQENAKNKTRIDVLTKSKVNYTDLKSFMDLVEGLNKIIGNFEEE